VAVIVYVVVCCGDTDNGPFNGTVALTPEIVTAVAFATVHDSDTGVPAPVEMLGVAAHPEIVGFVGGDTTGLTVMVAVAVVEPNRFVAVSVYVVVVDG